MARVVSLSVSNQIEAARVVLDECLKLARAVKESGMNTFRCKGYRYRNRDWAARGSSDPVSRAGCHDPYRSVHDWAWP